MKEQSVRSLSGVPFLLFLIVMLGVAIWLFATGIGTDPDGLGGPASVARIVLGVVLLFCVIGLCSVQPNQAAVLSLFGKVVLCGDCSTQPIVNAGTLFSPRVVAPMGRSYREPST